MKAGAVDYLRKPLDLDELALVVARVLASQALRRRLDYSQEREAHADAVAALLGESEAMVAARREIETIAAIAGDHDVPPPNVLLLGETGTGKDIAAHLIHGLGPRAARPFVRIDCAGLRGQDADKELFGGDRPGLLEAAEDGTVFLDEVGELAPDAQAKLLTVLERRRLGHPGERREPALAARFVAASNRDLAQAVRDGGFRADLFYRLDVLRVRMPPLRDCAGDAALLARHFLSQTGRRYGRAPPRLSPAAAAALARYDWPGNVRELAHLIERAVLLDRSGVLGVGDLPLATADVEPAASLAEAERLIMARALEQAGGNVSAAARRLAITRMTMRYRMRKHGL